MSPSTIILHHETNGLKSKSTPEQIANNIISLGTSVKSCENCVCVWFNELPTNSLSVFDHFVELARKGLTTRTDKRNGKVTKVNEVLHRKCGTINLPFINNSNIYPNSFSEYVFYVSSK